VVRQVREEGYGHKVHKEVVIANRSRVALGSINLLGEVMDNSRKVAEEITDEGNRVLGEEVMDNQVPGEDIRVKSSLKKRDSVKVDSIKSQPVAWDIKLEGIVDTHKVRHLNLVIINRQFVQIRTSQPTKLGIKLQLRAEDTVNSHAFLKQRHLPFRNPP